MKHEQTLTDNGVQVALFPMTHLNMSQGRYGTFSHSGYNAYDLTGKDTGIDKFFAPFDLYVEWVDNGAHKTGLVLSNLKKVLMASGKVIEPKSIKMMLWHDNDIKGIKVGQEIKQGQHFYDEGTAGYATGNHIHLELAYGAYDGTYPLFQLSNGYWTLKGTELNIEDCFFVNDTIVGKDLGYNFKTFVPKQAHKHTPEKWAFTANTRITKREYHGTDAKALGYVEAGETVIYTEKYNDDKHVWVKGNGFWVAVREVKNGVRQAVWGQLHEPNKVTKEYLQLDKNISTWTIHKIGQLPTNNNIVGNLNPNKFGGLTYEILAKPYADVVTIKTRDYGKVNLYYGGNNKKFASIK